YILIYAKGYRHLVVVDETGKLEGLATEYDFLTHLGLDFFVVSKTAQEISKKDFQTLQYHQTLEDILNLFEESKVNSILIMHNQKIEAIISEKEILEFAKGKLSQNTRISDLPLRKPAITTTTTLLQDVVVQMYAHNTLQLIVLDANEIVYGLIERHDIMSAFHGKAVELLINSLDSKESTINQLETQKKELDIFLAAFETSINAILITDKDAVIQWANPAFAKLTGYEISYALGKKPSELISSGLQSKEFYEVLWKCIEQGNPWQGILTNKRKDGTLYHEKLSITPLRDTKGEVTHYIGFKEDITLEENLKNQLIRSENRFRELFEQAPLPYQSLDKNGVILDINRAWLDHFGYTKKEVIGHRYAEFIMPSSLATLKKNFPTLLSSGAIDGVEFEFITKHRGVRWVQIQGRTSKDFDGNFLHTHCILTDITDQKNFIEELQYNEKKFKELFVNAPYAYQSLDINGNILDINKKWSELVGYGEEEVKGKFIGDFLTEESRIELPNAFANFIQNGYVRNQSFSIIHKENKTLSIE
ncbi:MAG: PAS domain S-box protein, partial [Sulfurimonas sp.]